MVKVHKEPQVVSRPRRTKPQPSKDPVQVQSPHPSVTKKDIKKDGKVIKYPWCTRWLKGRLFSNVGPEYMHMLRNMQAYIKELKFKSYFFFDHPNEIYQYPESKILKNLDGLIYFIQARQLDSDFRFPRTQKAKIFKWKKMNFPTLLPHHNPVVRYKVASSIQRDKTKDKYNPANEPVFRMHLVEPYRNNFGFVLCHIRKMTKHETDKEEKNAKKIERKKEPGVLKQRNYLLEDRVMTRSNLAKLR